MICQSGTEHDYHNELFQFRWQATFPWVFHAIDGCTESRGDIDCSAALPGRSPAEQLVELKKVQAWLKSLPLSRRLLVKVGSCACSSS